jgi:hypothetical protein
MIPQGRANSEAERLPDLIAEEAGEAMISPPCPAPRKGPSNDPRRGQSETAGDFDRQPFERPAVWQSRYRDGWLARCSTVLTFGDQRGQHSRSPDGWPPGTPGVEGAGGLAALAVEFPEHWKANDPAAWRSERQSG